MDTGRRTARLVGILFITGTLAGVLSAVFTGPTLGDPDYLLKVGANQNQILTGVLLVLVMGFALAMIPASLFPIFRRYNEALALGALVFRGALEAAGYIGIVLCWLLLITVGQQYKGAGTTEAAALQSIGALILAGADWITQLLAIVFSLGALMIYSLFYRSRLIPLWLSIWGLVGAVLYLATPLLHLFGLNLDFLMAPLALQEIVLALWLIVKGFGPAEIVTQPETA